MTEKQNNELILYSNMRTMISLVDKLRDFNLHEYISLPRITVVGDQSAGKSSILESICGMNFLPRGSGIVTRRPLELRLIREAVKIPHFIFPKDFPGQKFTNQEEVRIKIEELTEKLAGTDKVISDVPIVLMVYSSTVPDLSLVDLPGITRVPIGRQPQNIEEITKNLIRKYCEDSNSLMLCVISANVDLATSDALNFAQKLDPNGFRTLGVLTKIDLMDEGCDCRKILMNEEIKLQYGYVGIKGRSQKDIVQNKSVGEAIDSELNFFARHPIYSTLSSDLLGTRALIDRVSSILFDMIKIALPKIKNEIVERKKKAKDQFDICGEEMPETDERKQELIFKMVRAFKNNFDQEITGKFCHEISSNKNRREKVKKMGETITFQLNGLFSGLYEDFTDKEFRITGDYTDEYIRNAIEVYQGDSMPGFQSFDAFLFLINPKMRLLHDPVYSLLEEAKSILELKGTEILDLIFKKYPRLLIEVKENFLKELTQTRNSTRKLLENLLRCNENYWFTNDPYMVEGTVLNISAKTKGKDVMIMELRNRIEKYFYIVIRNIRNTVPKIIGSFLLRKLQVNLEVSILNSLSRKNYLIDVFEENDAMVETRKKVRQELVSLTNAENLLISEFGMGFTISSDSVSERKFESNIGASQMIHKEEDEADLMAEIESMNDNYLVFNQRLIANSKNKDSQFPTQQFLRAQMSQAQRQHQMFDANTQQTQRTMPNGGFGATKNSFQVNNQQNQGFLNSFNDSQKMEQTLQDLNQNKNFQQSSHTLSVNQTNKPVNQQNFMPESKLNSIQQSVQNSQTSKTDSSKAFIPNKSDPFDVPLLDQPVSSYQMPNQNSMNQPKLQTNSSLFQTSNAMSNRSGATINLNQNTSHLNKQAQNTNKKNNLFGDNL